MVQSRYAPVFLLEMVDEQLDHGIIKDFRCVSESLFNFPTFDLLFGHKAKRGNLHIIYSYIRKLLASCPTFESS